MYQKFKTQLPKLLIIISLLMMIYRVDLSWFNTHMSRDLSRSENWLIGQWSDWLGPEMGWDFKRLPGPLYYILLAPLLYFESLQLILVVKAFISVTIVYFLQKEINLKYPKAIITFLMLFVAMPVYIFTSRNIWNPAFIVSLNCLQFIFFLKFDRTKSIKWILWSTFIAAIGVQIHFSTLIIYLSFTLTTLLHKQNTPLAKRTQFIGLVTILVCLGLWYYLDKVPQLDQQLENFYGFNNFIFYRMADLKYHLYLSLIKLKDYDLFTVLTRGLNDLRIINFDALRPWINVLGNIYLFYFLYSLYFLIKNYFKIRQPIDLFLFVHVLIFFISIVFLKNREHAPYRYGLCLYPLQFFIMAYTSMSLKKYFKNIVKTIAFFSFIFFAYFNFNLIEVQNKLGRTYHTNNDTLELTLKNKTYIYNFWANSDGDPFQYLHGRAINKFRLKEMNWEQTVPYFGLYRLTTGRSLDIYKDTHMLENKKSWLVQLKNISELIEDSSSNIKKFPLEVNNFPQDLKIRYLDENNSVLSTVEWQNSGNILPLAFFDKIDKTKALQLSFNLNTKENCYLNLLIDDNDNYLFAYKNNYSIYSVIVNNNKQKPIRKYKGFFLVQNQYIFELPKQENLSLVIYFKVNTPYKNFSRLDLFSTDFILKREELFSKQNLE